jgi:molybdate transport system substrate-binding protein
MRTSLLRLAPLLVLGTLLAFAGCGDAAAPTSAAPAGAGRAASSARPAPSLTIAAAASLRELLEATQSDFAASHDGAKLSFSFEASSALSRKIEEGGAFDAFLSADAANVDRLKERVEASTRRVFLANRLALVGRSDLASPPSDPAALAAGTWSLALAAPAVPAGKYARAYLEQQGLTVALTPRITNADDVRAALALVEAGTVDLAFVYLSDAKIAKNSKLLWTAPREEDPGIAYVAAAVRGAQPAAAAYVEWLGSEPFLKQAEALGFERPVD